jgi:Na+/proline symporter
MTEDTATPIYKKRFKRFSGLSRRQLGLFMVSAFSFVVSFAWNTFAQNVFQTVVPQNLKNSASVLLTLQLIYALFVTLMGAIVIAYVHSRRSRIPDEPNPDIVSIRSDFHALRTSLEVTRK